jgi:hypothetical protein
MYEHTYLSRMGIIGPIILEINLITSPSSLITLSDIGEHVERGRVGEEERGAISSDNPESIYEYIHKYMYIDVYVYIYTYIYVHIHI